MKICVFKVPDIKEEEEVSSGFEIWVLKVGQFVLNNLEDFVWDTYANHVIRTVVECLGGISSAESATNWKKPSPSHGQSKFKIPATARKVPQSYVALLKEYVHRLSSWPQFPGL